MRRHTAGIHLAGGILLLLIDGSLGAVGVWFRLGAHTADFQLGRNIMEMKGNRERITECVNADQPLC